jgi:pyruvate/2-oxoglutarate dehydrogenase complex dihydrolipoamide dehydrogenase (E3) component
MHDFDAIVIGSGKAGTPLALDLAERGMKTALIDGRFIGSSAIEERGITKSYAVCSRNAKILQNAEKFGFTGSTHPLSANIEILKIRAGDLSITSDNTLSLQIFKTPGLLPVGGYASFIGSNTVLVIEGSGESYRISAPKIFISTGSRNYVPPITGLADVGFLSAESLWKLEQIPSHLIIIGGGYVGIETAQEFCRFGSKVTVIQRNKRILPYEDPDFSGAVQELLISEGLRIITGAEITAVSRTPLNDLSRADPVCVNIQTPGRTESVEGSHVFIASGRVPNTETLNLRAAGIGTDSRGYITVNNRLETSADSVWAMGDVTGSPAFSNLSLDDYRIVSRNLFGDGTGTREGRIISTTLSIDPPLAGVGLHESDLKGSEPYRVIQMPVKDLQYAKDSGEIRGFIKAIVDENSGRILGFCMLGPAAGELAGAAHLAIMGKLTFQDLKMGLFSRPGAMEAFNELFKL